MTTFVHSNTVTEVASIKLLVTLLWQAVLTGSSSEKYSTCMTDI